MSELIDRRATKELFCKQCDVVAGIREQICKDSGCWIIKQINEIPAIDAVPVEEIETYRKMWLARANKLGASREGIAYSAMAYAAKVMLYFQDVSKHLHPPGAGAKEFKFKKWSLFDNADPEEEKE